MTATVITPLNELRAAAVTFTGEPAAPATMVSDVGDTVSVKSGKEATVKASVVE